MNPSLQQLMREATRMTQDGRLAEATEAIQRALGGGHATAGGRPQPPAPAHTSDRATGVIPMGWSQAPPLVLDGCVFETAERNAPAPAPGTGTGEFIDGVHSHGSLTRRYKLYIPPGHAGQSLPLVVMLHGCTQDPDDFAAGTGMNTLAREQGFLVLYPAQAQDANPSRCWNWFKHNHQRRERGEAALLADMARAVSAQFGIDTRRVYIAGLSAGGAMAATIAGLFPEQFAAVGVHSGLPAGAASNMAEALSAMRSGSKDTPHTAVPTIVFHGDQDSTVHPRNGDQVIRAALAGAATGKGPGYGSAEIPVVEQGTGAMGRRYTRTIHRDGTGRPLAEHWLVHGAGHAWSGGLAAGTYADAAGPDASAEMLRFFFSQAGARH